MRMLFALLLAWQIPPAGNSPFPASDLERAGGWVPLCEEASRSAWGEFPEGWSLEGGILRRAPDTLSPLGWPGVFAEFELDFQWRETPFHDLAWQPGRVVLRRDDTALALIGAERIERTRQVDLPSFSAGCIELTPAQTSPGWRLGLRAGAGELQLRRMVLRDRAAPLGTQVALFDGRSLAGWRPLGDAKFSVQDGELVGEVGGGSQSFLRTERTFSDFIIEVELLNELPGNSGIQVRSQETAEKRLRGYQIEIDPSPRAWSGGLYDEARRGWLDDLSDNPQGRAAFRGGEWNRYRIECIGPWIRAWVNDVPTADFLDAADLEGAIGLQVHSGNDTKVRWRNFRMRDLGRSRWAEIERVPGSRVSFVARPSALENRVEDGFQLGPRGGDLALVYRMQVLDEEGSGGDIERLTQSRSIVQVDLRGDGWLLRIPADLESIEDHRLTILCHPPRVAVELDGRRLKLPAFETAPRRPDGAIEVRVVRGAALEPGAHQSLDRR